MSPSKMVKPPSAGTGPGPGTGAGTGGAGVGISPPRHDQLGRPTPPSARPVAISSPTSPNYNNNNGSPTKAGSGSPKTGHILGGNAQGNGSGGNFRPNNPFAQRQYQRQQQAHAYAQQQHQVGVDSNHPALASTRPQPTHAHAPGAGHSPSPLSSPVQAGSGTGSPRPNPTPPMQGLVVPPRRRDRARERDQDGRSGTPTPPTRRPVPALTSPEMSGIPRLTSPNQSPRMGMGLGIGLPASNGLAMGMPVPRPAVRQPSTPALLAASRKPISDPNTSNRPRAKSTATPTAPTLSQSSTPAQQGGRGFRPPPAIIEREREPAVPAHIRVRLRLIHQLGVVLGVDAGTIASKIDIPCLLARVDAAYDRGHGGFIDLPSDPTQPGVGGSPSTSASTAAGAGVSSPSPSYQGGGGAGGKKEGGGGVLGMFRKLGGGGAHSGSGGGNGNGNGVVKGTKEEQQPLMPSPSQPSEGPAFGVPLYEMPDNSWCTSLIGGQKHELPLVVFTVIEEIYRRGMSQPGIFRLAGDGTRISHLTKVFNMPPLYGDSLSISSEPIHNLTGLVKRYVRDMPEPILDESLFPAFMAFCLDPAEDVGSPPLRASEPDNGYGNTNDDTSKPNDTAPNANTTAVTTARPLSVRIAVAQILLRLLPPSHFSLFIYLLAFLGQLPLFPDNRLNVESISIIFGPAMVAARGRGIAGLGPNSIRPGEVDDPEMISELVNSSQSVLGWLLRHWGMISEKVLDNFIGPGLTPGQDLGVRMCSSGSSSNLNLNRADPKLLAPINLKSSSIVDPTFAIPPPPLGDPPPTNSVPIPIPTSRTPIAPKVDAGSASAGSSSTGYSETVTATAPPSRPVSPAPSFTGGLFSRAFSSRNISAQANDESPGEVQKVKRSTSFTSISSMVKKGSGAFMAKLEPKGTNIEAARSLSAEKLTVREAPPVNPTANPQISNILGSLHDLLVSKDKQIERDARELALLRYTLLEMDEKLTKLTSQSNSSSAPGPGPDSGPDNGKKRTSAPQITITSTPSALQLSQASQQEITDLQAQLTTTLAALETARLSGRNHERRILDLEAKLSRADSARGVEVGKLQVALAIEQGKVVAMAEERDEAKQRLEKIKTTLFAVS